MIFKIQHPPILMDKLKITVIVIWMLCGLSSGAQQLSEKYTGYTQQNYKSVRYGLFKPKDYDSKKRYPLIVYLHGSTDTLSRDMQWYNEAFQQNHPCFVLTPKCVVSDQGWGNTWREGHTMATAVTLELVDVLLKDYSIDPDRLYLYGISMGGFGVFSILAKEQNKFAAAYSVCGGSNTAAAGSLLSTPLWIFHGAIDDVVPVAISRDPYHEIIRLGGKRVRYTEYPGVKHNSWENVSREKTLSDWLFAQRRGAISELPDPVTHLKIETPVNGNTTLKWNKPVTTAKPYGQAWYYKVFRDDVLLGEVESEVFSLSDSKTKSNTKHTYRVVTVNYLFAESKPAELRAP